MYIYILKEREREREKERERKREREMFYLPLSRPHRIPKCKYFRFSGSNSQYIARLDRLMFHGEWFHPFQDISMRKRILTRAYRDNTSRYISL